MVVSSIRLSRVVQFSACQDVYVVRIAVRWLRFGAAAILARLISKLCLGTSGKHDSMRHLCRYALETLVGASGALLKCDIQTH